MSDVDDSSELASLRREVAELRRLLLNIAFSLGDGGLIVSELLRRIDRHASLHIGLGPSRDGGMADMPLSLLRDRIEGAVSEVEAVIDKLIAKP